MAVLYATHGEEMSVLEEQTTLSQRATELFEQRHYEEALALCEQAAAIDPQFATQRKNARALRFLRRKVSAKATER
jgi:hypothetical protein